MNPGKFGVRTALDPENPWDYCFGWDVPVIIGGGADG